MKKKKSILFNNPDCITEISYTKLLRVIATPEYTKLDFDCFSENDNMNKEEKESLDGKSKIKLSISKNIKLFSEYAQYCLLKINDIVGEDFTYEYYLFNNRQLFLSLYFEPIPIKTGYFWLQEGDKDHILFFELEEKFGMEME